jgi:hypothetical protein
MMSIPTSLNGKVLTDSLFEKFITKEALVEDFVLA